MIQMNAPDIDNAQEIDLIELAKRLWSERKFLFKCCGIAVIVGLVVAYQGQFGLWRVLIVEFVSYRHVFIVQFIHTFLHVFVISLVRLVPTCVGHGDFIIAILVCHLEVRYPFVFYTVPLGGFLAG